MEPQVTKNTKKPQRFERRYKKEREFDHDLFKLNPSIMKRDMGYSDKPNLTDMEHSHSFHTVDSNGKPQMYSSTMGGHCHEVTVKENENGEFEVKVGPPIRVIGGQKQKVVAYIGKDDYGQTVRVMDEHSHDTQYIFSEKIKARTTNKDAQLYIAQNAK